MSKKILETKVIKTNTAVIKGVNVKDYTVDALISSEAKDRDGEIIMTSAWATGLEEYMKHPILLSSHNYFDLRDQIGKAVSVQMTPEGLVAKFQYFVGQGNEEADWAFNLAKNGIAAYSVGFVALDWADGNQDEGVGRIFTSVKLMEVSQVLIPSNPTALQRNSKDPLIKELCEMAVKAFKPVKKDTTVIINIDDDDDDSQGASTGNNSDSEYAPCPNLPQYQQQEIHIHQESENPVIPGQPIGGGTPIIYSMDDHQEMVKKCMHEVLKSFFGNGYSPDPAMPKHYSEILLNRKKDQPESLDPNESIKVAQDAITKTITEGLKI